MAAFRSIENYGQIEEESGIKFFTECGFLFASDTAKTVETKKVILNSRLTGFDIEELEKGDVEQKFGFLNFPGGMHSISDEILTKLLQGWSLISRG